jgi:transposase
VWGWRREARTGDLVLPSEALAAIQPTFVPIVSETPPMAAGEGAVEPGTSRLARTASAPTIEIKLAGAVVRVAVGTDGILLTEVLRAVRASAT